MATKQWQEENIDKMRQYRRDWYRRNSVRAHASVNQRRQQLREWLREIKACSSCLHCGESYPACLVFHHRDPSVKDVDLGKVICDKGWAKERILEEIAKCDILCANCHLKLHDKLRVG